MKLRKSTFKYIEAEVFSYNETLKEIDKLITEIKNPYNENQQDPDMIEGANSAIHPGDPTGRIASKLVEDKQLKRMRQVTDAIHHIYDSMLPEKKELVKLYYWDRPGELTWEGVAKEINVGRRTAIRWREKFVYDIAAELGER